MKYLYVMLMENRRNLNLEIVQKHVNHLRSLEQNGKLYLCGPFTDYAGGIEILVADSFEEAKKIAESDPFISEGYKTFELRTLEVANKDNNYLV